MGNIQNCIETRVCNFEGVLKVLNVACITVGSFTVIKCFFYIIVMESYSMIFAIERSTVGINQLDIKYPVSCHAGFTW